MNAAVRRVAEGLARTRDRALNTPTVRQIEPLTLTYTILMGTQA